MSILKTENIAKHFGGIYAIKDISIELGRNDLVSIIGPNGAGKTTLFNLISGVYKPEHGKVIFQDSDITTQPPHMRSRGGISRTFQNIRLFEGLSVKENILAAMDPRSKYNLFDAFFLTPARMKQDKENVEKAHELLDIIGLWNERDKQPGNLPYGLQRKLEIARALASEPAVLLLDEPAAGLNPSEVRDFIDLIHKIKEDFGLSILLIEHRMQVVMEMSRWIYVINFGELLAQGKPDEIQKNPEVIKAYIGEEEAC
ncbi:MAG: ABC transporter ATP-binding protein [Spirochaetales bacterium]|nr:ABC transporter ATP-binding protein [Spirochaetales bacterium]